MDLVLYSIIDFREMNYHRKLNVDWILMNGEAGCWSNRKDALLNAPTKINCILNAFDVTIIYTRFGIFL